MSDLETAAHEAVDRVQSLLQGLGDAQRECHEARGYVETLGQQLAEDRKALAEAVADLEQTIGDADVQLADEARVATAAATVLASAFRQAGTDGPRDLQAEAAGTEGAATLLGELSPRVTELAEAADAASQAALEHATAIAQSLEESIAKVEHIVGVQFAALVADVREQVEHVTNDLVHFLGETCPAALDKGEGEWREKLGTLNDLLSTTMQKLEEHGQEVATHTEDKWSRLLDEEVAELGTEARLATDGLSGLARYVTDKDGQLQVAADMVSERLRDAAAAAATLEGAYNQALGRWATFGISGYKR